MCQFPADQSYKADNAEQHEKTEQEYIPNSGSVPGQYIDSSRNESCCQERKTPKKTAGFIDGELSYIHFCDPPIHI